MDISLDDYIRQNDIEKPFEKKDRGGGGKSSKFDRYNRDNGNVQFNDADADEYDEPMDDDDGNMDMPRLVPIKQRTHHQPKPQQQQQQQQLHSLMSLQPRVPVHERLGRRDSMSSDAADSIIVNVTNRRPNNNMMKRLNYNRNYNVGSINGRSNIQHRLNKNFVNPAIVARNNFSINAINSFMESAMKTFGGAQQDTGAVQNGNIMAALASRIMSSMADPKKTDTIDEHKYDMQIQKEISSIQKKPLYFKCPGATVVSCDGPGIDERVAQHATNMSLNQRFG